MNKDISHVLMMISEKNRDKFRYYLGGYLRMFYPHYPTKGSTELLSVDNLVWNTIKEKNPS